MKLDSRIPDGPVQDKWEKRKFELKLVNPANKRKYKVLVVGSGLYVVMSATRPAGGGGRGA